MKIRNNYCIARDHHAKEVVNGRMLFPNTQFLIVDRNSQSRLEVVRRVMQWGGQIMSVSTPDAAIRYLDVEHFDILFISVEFAEEKYRKATRILMNRAALRDLPVVLMKTLLTGLGDNDADIPPANDYLYKPFDDSGLADVVSRQLGSLDGLPNYSVRRGEGAARLVKKTGSFTPNESKNQGVYFRSLYEFIQETTGLSERLQGHLSDGALDFAELETFHCKIAAVNVGAVEVAKAAHHLEYALRARANLCDVESLVVSLVIQIRKKQVEFDIMSNNSVAIQECGASQSAYSVVESLRVLLENFDTEAVPFFVANTTILHAALNMHFLPVRSAVFKFEFRIALVCLNRAMKHFCFNTAMPR